MKHPFNDPIALREILTYDFIEVGSLSIGERIVIHQWIGRGLRLTPELKIKIVGLYKAIKNKGWESPKCRYNDHKEMQISKFGTGNWSLFEPKY